MTPGQKRSSADWLSLWIFFSAWSSLSGWVLSVPGWLTPIGFSLSYTLFIGLLYLFRTQLVVAEGSSSWRLFRSRYVAPRIWLLLAALAFIGGVAYAPNNYDYLTYRFPRVLNWSWEHAWFWVPTINSRINYSGAGFEWLMTPLLVVFKTDRLFFFINFIPYLFLPGLIFSVFVGMGISRRISWWWMWVLPCGYCYILQAASVGNDSFAAVYFLASLHYLFHARTSPARNLFLSCLAIALMTGVKATNLPLVLPWAVALYFQWAFFFQKFRPVTAVLILIAAASVSFLPMALLNIHFTGDYSGDPGNQGKMKLSRPAIGVLGNFLQMTKDNLVPPLLPRSVDWGVLLPSPLKTELHRDFPRIDLLSEELQIEEGAGLGLGIVVFATLAVVAGIRTRIGNQGLISPRHNAAIWISAAGAIALLVYMSKMGSEATSRLIAAYYPLLIIGVLVLVSLDGTIIRARTFRWIAYITMCSAIPLLILSPARPLFPVQLMSRIMTSSHVPSGLVVRFNDVYRVYALRANSFSELLTAIPASERAIGFLQMGNAPQAALWRPFGSRKVVEVFPQDSIDDVKGKGIRVVAVSQDALANRYHLDIGQILAKWSGSLVAEKKLVLTIHNGAETWYVVELQHPN